MGDGSPKPIGRPTDYDPAFCQQAAELCINGATDFEVAEAIGVDVRTIYRWKAKFPEFSQALRVGKELADDRVEFSLFHRAVGYSHAAVKIMQNNGAPVIVPYIEHVPPETGAATLWLTNRRGDKWRAKVDHTHANPDGSPLVVQLVNYADPNSAPLQSSPISVAVLSSDGPGGETGGAGVEPARGEGSL
jgi:hypothetical protein